jgi:hypothetical protein
MNQTQLRLWQFSLTAFFAAITVAAVIAAIGRLIGYEALICIVVALWFIATILGFTFRLIWFILGQLRHIVLTLICKH